jgi:Lon protease-like protein
MDIQVQGERRFRIRQIDESKPYMVGKVEPVIELDLEENEEVSALLYKAREECELLVKRRFEHQGLTVKVVFPPDPVALSFTIANLLPMENLEKQRLLETVDTRERVESLIPIIERQMIQSPLHRLAGNDLSEYIFPN